MSLSKQQMLGAVGAGVFVLCAGGLGFLTYSAWDERAEAEEKLEGLTSDFMRYNNAPVFPSKASIESVKSNAINYAAWHDGAVAFASRGDLIFPEESGSLFKQRLQGEVRRMGWLAGGVEGKIANAGFLFGFEQYLGEGGVIPDDKDVPRLSEQLDSISHLVDLFAESGVLEVKKITRIEEKVEEEVVNNKNKKNAKKQQAKAEDENAPKMRCLKYGFELAMRPAALVTMLNRITSSDRFLTMHDLCFKQSADIIVERLNQKDNANEAGGNSGGGRRGRRGRVNPEQQEAAAKAAADPLIIDPEADAPILVSFTLEVRDLGYAAVASKKTEEKGDNQ